MFSSFDNDFVVGGGPLNRSIVLVENNNMAQDAVLRGLGYQRLAVEQVMVNYALATEINGTTPTTTPETKPQLASYQSNEESKLQALPLEILHHTFAYLDILSLVALKLTSRGFSVLLEGFLPLQELFRYAKPAAMVVANSSNVVSVSRLHHILRHDRCEYCNRAYGPYVYLLRCTRTCYPCLRSDPCLLSVPPREAKRITGTPLKKINALPTIHRVVMIPGSWPEKNYRPYLVSIASAYELAKDKRNSLEALMKEQPEVVEEYSEEIYFTATCVAMPYLGRDQVGHHGIWCSGCKYEWNAHRYRRGHMQDSEWDEQAMPKREALEKAYSESELLAHIKTCSGIKEMKSAGELPQLEEQFSSSSSGSLWACGV